MNTPWAVLLVKFSDNNAEPYARKRYEEIFTNAGSGKWNMVDYFREMSHGKLDLSGSKVFGWYTLNKKQAEYLGSGTNAAGRQELIDWARAKATDNGVNLNNFFSLVVVLNVPADLFGGGSGVVCGDDGSNSAISGLSPSFLGQEMGHSYGLRHSRKQGSYNDYEDRYDVMSVAMYPSMLAPHPVYKERDPRGQPVFQIGPGLNAANMWSQGWLNEARTWNDTGSSRVSASIQLRPLHRYDLPGFLAARFAGYFIEFRINSGWDSAIDPVVLIHSFKDGNSYLVSDNNGNEAFGPGSAISTPEGFSVYGSGFAIIVNSIDTDNQIATLSLIRTPAEIPQAIQSEKPGNTPWIKWSELFTNDEALVIINGNAISIPRHSPAYQIVENIPLYMQAGPRMSGGLQAAIREEAISNIWTISQREISKVRFLEPAKPLMRKIDAGHDAENE